MIKMQSKNLSAGIRKSSPSVYPKGEQFIHFNKFSPVSQSVTWALVRSSSSWAVFP